MEQVSDAYIFHDKIFCHNYYNVFTLLELLLLLLLLLLLFYFYFIIDQHFRLLLPFEHVHSFSLS